MLVLLETTVLPSASRYASRKEAEVTGFGDEEWDFSLIEAVLKGEGRVKLRIFAPYRFSIKSGEYSSVPPVYCSKTSFSGQGAS